MAFRDRSGSGSPSSSPSRRGTICHETPQRSLSQPHGPGSPPSARPPPRPAWPARPSLRQAAEASGLSRKHLYELIKRVGDPARGIDSIQVEINKKLFMDTKTFRATENLPKVRTDLDRLLRVVAKEMVRLARRA